MLCPHCRTQQCAAVPRRRRRPDLDAAPAGRELEALVVAPGAAWRSIIFRCCLPVPGAVRGAVFCPATSGHRACALHLHQSIMLMHHLLDYLRFHGMAVRLDTLCLVHAKSSWPLNLDAIRKWPQRCQAPCAAGP
jgi:hypothetical protein